MKSVERVLTGGRDPLTLDTWDRELCARLAKPSDSQGVLCRSTRLRCNFLETSGLFDNLN
jgi:hypothetical protein